jgi:transketolase N-terminal domain/subunit
MRRLDDHMEVLLHCGVTGLVLLFDRNGELASGNYTDVVLGVLASGFEVLGHVVVELAGIASADIGEVLAECESDYSGAKA